ncbi:hypothetical protein HMPREF0239_01039 [Clostridium sp. ATCC BAA-442]|nr:hypothetical protein HMPREF0239_01039 [Clostridium sp. ATCC BAA-442]
MEINPTKKRLPLPSFNYLSNFPLLRTYSFWKAYRRSSSGCAPSTRGSLAARSTPVMDAPLHLLFEKRSLSYDKFHPVTYF